jgi:hypothetical protein
MSASSLAGSSNNWSTPLSSSALFAPPCWAILLLISLAQATSGDGVVSPVHGFMFHNERNLCQQPLSVLLFCGKML